MSDLAIVLLVIVFLFAFGGLPRWGYHPYGYGPSGALGTLLLIILILALLGRL